MATASERYGIRDADKSAELPYLVEDATGSSDARSTALAAAPTTFNGKVRQDARAEEVAGTDGTYLVDVLYGVTSGTSADTGSEQDSFEIAITPTQVFTSRETISAHAPFDPWGPQIPDFQGAINVDSDGRVNGVQWPPATAQVITRTRVVASSSVTETYYRAMSALVGHVNSNTYLGFDPGELLFLGASGTRRAIDASEPWIITWKFGVSLNESNLTLGSQITIPSKNGWHYAWVYYREREDSDAKMLIPRPVAAYVERIAIESSFTGLIL